LAAWALLTVTLAPVPEKLAGPVQLIVNGEVPPLTVTLSVAEAPAQIGAGGAIVHVGLGLTTRVAVQLVVHPAASVICAV
jgi:hypothetical protein